MKKIRVLHILDELNTGGAERIVFTYFQHIDRDKFQWDFVMTRYSNPEKKGLLEDSIQELGGHIYRVHRKRENYLKHIRDIDQIIKKGNYDIVHSHLDELSAFYLMSAKKYGVKVRICHSHLSGADRGRMVEILCKFLKPFMNRLTTDKFACGNSAAIALWGEKAFDSNQVHIMKNAIETEKFAFDSSIRNKIRNKYKMQDKIVIGSVGRLSYQKNSEFIVDIFNSYHKNEPNSFLVVVGVGDKLDEMKKMVHAYKIEDSVAFLGSRSDVNELLMAMDLFLLPSRFEGLPIVMVEAQCSGLTCLVSDSITREISINENVYYFSINDSSEKWAEKIVNISNTNSERKNGLVGIVDSGYDIEDAVNGLMDYYLKAVGR